MPNFRSIQPQAWTPANEQRSRPASHIECESGSAWKGEYMPMIPEGLRVKPESRGMFLVFMLVSFQIHLQK